MIASNVTLVLPAVSLNCFIMSLLKLQLIQKLKLAVQLCLKCSYALVSSIEVSNKVNNFSWLIPGARLAEMLKDKDKCR